MGPAEENDGQGYHSNSVSLSNYYESLLGGDARGLKRGAILTAARDNIIARDKDSRVYLGGRMDDYVLVHADGGACHGTPLVGYKCPKCGISPDMQSTEFWSSSLINKSVTVGISPLAGRLHDHSMNCRNVHTYDIENCIECKHIEAIVSDART